MRRENLQIYPAVESFTDERPKNKCGSDNKFTSNVNTNLFIPGDASIAGIIIAKGLLIQTCLITLQVNSINQKIWKGL